MNSPIVLLTDFGWRDSFVGVMKGVISKINPKAKTLDLSHGIPPQDVRRAAFELFTSVEFFPRGSLFVAVVDPGVGSGRKILFAKTKNYFFLAPDNGLLSWVFLKERPLEIVSVENKKYFLSPVSKTFHGRDIFSSVAAWWSRGKAPDDFGPRIKSWREIPFPYPTRRIGRIEGEVISVDHFGNLITNIPNGMVPGRSRRSLTIRIGKHRLQGLSESYAGAPAGGGKSSSWRAVEGSHGFLEIALKNGSASQTLKTGAGEQVNIVLS